MCGIAGFTHFGKKPARGVLQRAVDSLVHRGPNQQGVYEGQDASLGAVRLKIIDLEGGDQPIQTEDGSYVIVFNGEIYNHASIRRELEQLGHRFQSHCDTEVALRAFVQWDVDAFERFRGMFAAAFWQPLQRRLLLVRDRLGIKPLYVSTQGGDIYFGSELKALFEHPAVPRRISGRGLGFFLSLNYVPSPYTLADGIVKIKPGSWFECCDGRIRTGAYWTNRFRPEKISLDEASDRLDQLLNDSIAEHLLSDVPLGIWASGGLDSSTILHYAAQRSSKRLQTFSISFSGKSWDESKYFRMLANHYGTDHHEFDLSTDLDLPAAIQQLAYYSDEPSADAGALPVWFLSQMTARHVTVALSGEGADEVFGGYQTYLADGYAACARKLPRPALRAAAIMAELLPVSDEKISLEYKLKRFLAGALLPSDDAHFFWNGTFSPREQKQLGSRFVPGPLSDLALALPDVPSDDLANRFLYIDQHYYLPDDILYKCDRMSMAHSLEVRPPFLDHRIVDFAAQLPSALKIKGRSTKHVLRHLVAEKLPAALLNRPKEGLDIPTHDWFRGPLKPLLLATLNRERVTKAGLFSPAAFEALVQQHMSRRANLGYHLWGLLTLQLWIERWKIESTDEILESSRSASAMVLQ